MHAILVVLVLLGFGSLVLVLVLLIVIPAGRPATAAPPLALPATAGSSGTRLPTAAPLQQKAG